MSVPGPEEPRRGDKGWRIFGTVLIVILVLAGLAAIAFVVLFFIAMNSFGSNK